VSRLIDSNMARKSLSMSRNFGPIRQVGYVVRDINQAMQYRIDVLGIGALFFLEGMEAERFCYRERYRAAGFRSSSRQPPADRATGMSTFPLKGIPEPHRTLRGL
jgi:hypothetical protein